VEYEDLVIGHTLLSHNHFFTAINNEVASLIILAVFSSSHSIILTQTVKLTELRSQHHWDLTNHHSCRCILSKNLLNLSFAKSSFMVQLILISVKFLL
jgi:hypothetical protein